MIYKLQQTHQNFIISGIYNITFPNGKCYIGMSNNIRKRILNHNERDYKLKRIVGYAIHKYGPITEFEVLEEIPSSERKLMSEREKFWIKTFHSTEYKYGYNRSEGGEGLVSCGCDNGHAAFAQEDLDALIIDLLENPTISMTKLAEKYGVSRTTIHSINQGQSYHNNNLHYPLRDWGIKEKAWTGTKSSCAKLTDEQILEIYDKLAHSLDSQAAIARQYGISPSTITLINKGKRYHNDNIKYPIR